MLGTNKSNALRFDQYCDRTDITKMIPVNPHKRRFDNIEKLPMINSKFNNSFKLEINRTIGRKQASPKNFGNSTR